MMMPSGPSGEFGSEDTHGNFSRAHELEELVPQRTEFEFSLENPPSLEDLREHVQLVHITPRAPEGDVLYAAAHDYSRDRQWQDEAPPSYRPTLHTSMNEAFNSGDNEMGFSRDHLTTAVILPLSSVESQVASVFPNDTILVGDVHLDESTTVVLPEGEAYSGKAKVVRYRPDTEPLNEVVNRTIEASNGWPIRTNMFLDGPHSFASDSRVGETDITGRAFFSALLQEHPQLSYGSHFHSEVGEAWRSGLTDYLVADCLTRYSDSMQNQIPTDELKMRRELIAHNAAIFERSITEGDYGPHVQRTVREAGRQLEPWLNIIDADLYAREHFGKTLTDSGDRIWLQLREARNDPEGLRRAIEANHTRLPRDYDLPPRPAQIGSMVASMEMAEYHDFGTKFSEVTRQHGAEMDVAYAITRWMLIGTGQAEREGLNQVLAGRMTGANDQMVRMARGQVELYLDPQCGRQETAQDIAAFLATGGEAQLQ